MLNCLSVIVLVTGYLISSSLGNMSNVDKSRDLLMKHLLNNYQPSSRPGRWNETLTLFVDIELQHFDYRQQDGQFHLVGLMHVRWRDPKLTWHPLEYGNMTHIQLSQRQIWVPDLEFYNNAADKFLRMHRFGYVSVKNDGVVFWSDTVSVYTFCNTSLRDWPHEKHECELYLGSWIYDGFEVDLMHVNPNASMSFRTTNKENMQYRVTQFVGSHNAKYYSCCPQPYVTMNYKITFQRESSFAVIFRIPVLTVVMLTLISLYLQPERREKIWLNSLNIFLICCYLLYFGFSRIIFNKDTPKIVDFFQSSLVLATLSQLMAVFTTYASCCMFKPCLGSCITRLLNLPWMKYIIGNDSNKSIEIPTTNFNDEKHDDVSGLISHCSPQGDWQRLALFLQRILLILFALYFLILTTICYV